jgi:hypothetical protein
MPSAERARRQGQSPYIIERRMLLFRSAANCSRMRTCAQVLGMPQFKIFLIRSKFSDCVFSMFELISSSGNLISSNMWRNSTLLIKLLVLSLEQAHVWMTMHATQRFLEQCGFRRSTPFSSSFLCAPFLLLHSRLLPFQLLSLSRLLSPSHPLAASFSSAKDESTAERPFP